MWQKLNIRKIQQTGFFQHGSPGKLVDALKIQRKVIKYAFATTTYTHTQEFSTKSHALLVKC